MRIVTVIGARPQFVKAAVLSHTFRNAGIDEFLVHTGQHYDSSLSGIFFSELGLREPDVNLGVGSASHAAQTGAMMIGLEALFNGAGRPDAVLVYGDTNSTLAGALVAAKHHVPIIHVEAGLRSFNRSMPEELNRIVTDRLSTFLFCPTRTAVDELTREGIVDGVFLSGDVMYEATRSFSDAASDPFTEYVDGAFGIATVHRAENTDDPSRLEGIIRGLGLLDFPVLMPLHPRTAERLGHIVLPENIQKIDPVSYLTLLSLVRRASVVITDSGGLQKEAVWLGTRCLTLREETEWTETLAGGWNVLVGADPVRLLEAIAESPQGPPPSFGFEGGRFASDHIISALTR